MYNGGVGLCLLEKIDEARELITENKYDMAIEVLQGALLLIEKEKEVYSEEVVRICKLLGLCYRKQGLYERGIQIIYLAEQLCQKLYLKSNNTFWRRELALCYMNEAVMYDSQECMNRAIAVYERAVKIFKELEDDENVVKAMMTLGMAYAKEKDEKAVVSLCREALDVIGKNFLLEKYRKFFCEIKEDMLNKKEKY